MVRTGHVFRIEVISEDMPYTKDAIKEVKTRLLDSPHITEVLIEEIFEGIKLFKTKGKKET